MKIAIPITTLFLDIGGILLTDGWDHHARKRPATNFRLEFAEMEDGLKVAVVSNEARVECYRIRKFSLNRFLDSFISSCFVHVRKPDADIFRLALDVAQASAQQAVYIENTPMFVQIAEGLGIRSILHTDYRSTCAKLASLGLQSDDGVIHEFR